MNLSDRKEKATRNIFSKFLNSLSNLAKQNIIQKEIRQIEVELKRRKNSEKETTVISYYTTKDLSSNKEFFLRDDLSAEEIDNFTLINKDAKITIRNFAVINDELEHFRRLINIFKILEKHNRIYNITINVENRELLKQSGLLNNIKNINLTINNYFTEYTLEEFLVNESKLDELVKDIKESNLSPYKKYLAVYNKVKQFKLYKEHQEDPTQSRSLKYILDNEYMVCVGYADLLTTLLDKLGIPSLPISLMTDEEQHNENINERKPSKLSGHERNLIKIDDDECNIHGIFIVDATRDNDLDYDLYNNVHLTFDKIKECRTLDGLETEDLILDFHNFKEFSQKINFYLKREIHESIKETYQEKVIFEYQFLYYRILEILIKLDYQKYQELYYKYNNLINTTINQFEDKSNTHITLKDIENIFSDFLTEYAQYIIPLTNNKIDNFILYQSARIVKKEINRYTEEQLKEWENSTKEIYDILEEYSFPYSYNPKDTRDSYLTLAKKKHKR